MPDATAYTQALPVLQALRAAGVKVQMHGATADGQGSMKSQFKRADASGAAYALIFGADELARGEVTVKALRDGSGVQRSQPLADVASWAHTLQSRTYEFSAMANHLDLEEQEQLDQLKHFWAQWGNLITGVLVVILAAFAGWNFYQKWQRDQAAQASAMFDSVLDATRAKDTAKLDRALADMKDKFGGTTYAQQAALLAAKTYYEAGKVDPARAALQWVAEKSSDEGYQALAKLRLAGLLAEAKSYDEALAQLAGSFRPVSRGWWPTARATCCRCKARRTPPATNT